MIRPQLLLALLLTNTISSYGMQRALTHKITSVPFDYYLCMGFYLAFANQKNLAFAWEKRPNFRRQNRNCFEADQIVKDFVYAQLDPHQDATLKKKLKIKLIWDETSSMSTLTNTLFIHIKDHDRLATLLKVKNEDLSPEQQNLLAYYAVVTRHEIGHLKNHDSYYTRVLSPTVSLALHAGTWALAKLCSVDRYYKPSAFAVSQSDSNIFRAGCFLVTAGLAHYFIHDKLYEWYGKRKETRAEKYALVHTRDSRELRGYAQHSRIKRKENTDRLITQVIKEINQYSSSEPYLKIYSHYLHYKFLKKQPPNFKKTRYSPDALAAFRSWIEQQPHIIDTLEKMDDPIHETYSESIQQSEKAAELLDSYEKKHAAA